MLGVPSARHPRAPRRQPSEPRLRTILAPRALKGSSGAADIRAMAIHRVAPAPRPAPKATCPTCHRPVAVLKRGKCLYCGTEIPGLASGARSEHTRPPDLLIAFPPRAASVPDRSRWVRGLIALGVSVMLVAAMMGACMKA